MYFPALIHLSSALAREAKAFVATDARLREVAKQAGLRVIP